MRALDHRLPGQGRSQGGGGGRRGCVPPWGFGDPRADGPRGPRLRRRQPKPSHKSWNLLWNRQKSTSGQSGPLVPREKQGPSDYQRPSQLAGAIWIWGVLYYQNKGPLIRGPLLIIRALWLTGALPTVRGPSEYYSPLMGCFKLGDLKIPTFYLSFHFFCEFGPLPKNSGPIRGLFSFG